MSVIETRFRYDGEDGTALAGFKWTTGRPARAVLQLAHGAGEHAGRYRERLAPLMDAGFVVYAADHRGHGLTSGMSHLGDFGPGGAEACIRDMAQLSRLARTENPGLPLILMGHSMGRDLLAGLSLRPRRPDRRPGAVRNDRRRSAARGRRQQRLPQSAHRL